MSETPWIRFFPSDWLAGTRGLSAAETGVYITLIAMMYERAEPIQEDDHRLSRVCGSSPVNFRRALDALIDQRKIVRVEGGLWNARVAQECSLRSQKSDLARSSAYASHGENSKRKQQPKPANAEPPQSERSANQKPEPEPKKKEVDATHQLRARGATLLPADWSMSDELVAYGMALGLPRGRCLEIGEDLRVWAKGKGEKRADWEATCQGFLRREAKQKTGPPADQRPRKETYASLLRNSLDDDPTTLDLRAS